MVSIRVLKLAEWEYNFTVTKATERQIINHPEFEAVCSQYWGLARGQPGANLSKNTIDKKQYTEVSKARLKMLSAHETHAQSATAALP